MNIKYFYDKMTKGEYKTHIIELREIESREIETEETSSSIIYIDYNGEITDQHGNKYKIEDLTGNYESHNEFKVVKAGYLMFKDTNTVDDVLRKLTEFHFQCFCNEKNTGNGNIIYELEYDRNDEDIKRLSYLSKNNIFIEVSIIPVFSCWNNKRKNMDRKCLSFDRNVNSGQALYIYFADFYYNKNTKERANEALQDLLQHFFKANYSADFNPEWKEMKFKRYISY